jgi:hypothetical protein
LKGAYEVLVQQNGKSVEFGVVSSWHTAQYPCCEAKDVCVKGKKTIEQNQKLNC